MAEHDIHLQKNCIGLLSDKISYDNKDLTILYHNLGDSRNPKKFAQRKLVCLGRFERPAFRSGV